MASQHRKHRGYKTQSSIALYLAQFWPYAQSAGAGRQGKDITGVPFDLEAKARASFNPKEYIDQVKQRTSVSGELGFAVLRLNGQGDGNSAVKDYAAVIRFEDLVDLLIKAGYDKMPPNIKEAEPIRCLGCGSWIFEGMACATCNLLNKEK